MPQTGMNCNRRGQHPSTWKTNGIVNGKVSDTCLVNGADVHNGCSAAARRPSWSTPADKLCGFKPPRMVNGYINHGYKGKSTETAPPKTRGSAISAVTDASAAGRVSSAGVPGGVSVHGAARRDAVVLPCHLEQMVPDSSSSAAGKKQRRWKKFKCKKRDAEATCPESSASPLMPPQEKEDWENEIQEVTLTDWEKLIGVTPYGPEDVLHLYLQDLTLKERNAVHLPLIASYIPAAHHSRPVQWSCYSIPTEPSQFADADE